MYTAARWVVRHCHSLDRVRLPHVLSIVPRHLGVVGQRAPAPVVVAHTRARVQLCSPHYMEVNSVHPCQHQQHANSPLVVSCACIYFDLHTRVGSVH